MRTSAMLDERSLGELKRYGYIPFDLEGCGESVAKGLEYAIADDAVAKVAARLGIEDTLFMDRARAYRNILTVRRDLCADSTAKEVGERGLSTPLRRHTGPMITARATLGNMCGSCLMTLTV